jgi:uncharacterized circularly permuted ATP-grasp superfamily protein
VVNSSQGGGSKDTWVLTDDPTVQREVIGTNGGSVVTAGAQ